MSFFELDIVKSEKADAMRRYKRYQTCKFCLRVVGALTLLFCSLSYIPVVEEMASAYASLFNHQFPVFLIINFLVFLIYYLSTNTSANDASSVIQPDLYNQYISFSSSRRISAHDEKQLTCCENASTPMESNPARELVVTETYIQEKTFRRTRSQMYTVEKKRSNRRGELRRSETNNGMEMVVSGNYTLAGKSMQDMNNEEFKLTIDSFIASKKKILRDEIFAALMEEKEESIKLSLTCD